MAEPAPTAAAARAVPTAGALALMLLSGFAALAYQVVWTQQGTVWLGHEAGAVLAVIGAFFGGLALGAFALGRRVEASATPARWYAVCELVIGAWSLALVLLMAPAWRWPRPVPYTHPTLPTISRWLQSVGGAPVNKNA